MGKNSNTLIRKRRFCELHTCLKHILMMCQWSGHFPVEYLRNPRTLRFSLKTIYAVYYTVTCVIFAIETIASIDRIVSHKTETFGDLTNFLVPIYDVIVIVSLYRLAKHWPQLVHEAAAIEQTISELVQLPNNTHIKCIILSYTVIIIGFVEHCTYLYFKIQVQIYCSGRNELDVEVFDKFLKTHYATTFDYLPFYRWLAIFAQFVRFQSTLMWNVIDTFGMCFSIYLMSYFQELGKLIRSSEPKSWGKIRACYSGLAILLNLINKRLSPFIVLTSFFNLFFICNQLYHIIQSVLDAAYQLYYDFSFAFLIIRSMTFMYLATNVHTSATNAVLPLYGVPSSEYDKEVDLFQMQFKCNTPALSGVFFNVERRTILRVVATIITYELVLLQFGLPQKPTNINMDHPTNITKRRGFF